MASQSSSQSCRISRPVLSRLLSQWVTEGTGVPVHHSRLDDARTDRSGAQGHSFDADLPPPSALNRNYFGLPYQGCAKCGASAKAWLPLQKPFNVNTAGGLITQGEYLFI